MLLPLTFIIQRNMKIINPIPQMPKQEPLPIWAYNPDVTNTKEISSSDTLEMVAIMVVFTVLIILCAYISHRRHTKSNPSQPPKQY